VLLPADKAFLRGTVGRNGLASRTIAPSRSGSGVNVYFSAARLVAD
jgi:hypothetical protein